MTWWGWCIVAGEAALLISAVIGRGFAYSRGVFEAIFEPNLRTVRSALFRYGVPKEVVDLVIASQMAARKEIPWASFRLKSSDRT